MKLTQLRILMVIVVLAAATIACNLPENGSELPPTTAPMTTEEVKVLEENLEATLAAPAASGEVSITVTQQQLSAFLAAEAASQTNQVLTDPSVILTNGQMEVYGKVTQSGISMDSKSVLQPTIDENGNPRMDVVSIDIGPFPAPEPIKDRAELMVNEALNEYLSENGGGFKVTNIAITEGQMTVTGNR